MDKEKFKRSIETVYEIDKKETSIGVLEEKTTHSVLKFYYGDCIENQEIKIGSYHADVCVGNNIYEIQTRAFNKLYNKIICFSRMHYHVNVVFPVNKVRWTTYINDDLSYSPKRRNPRAGKIYDIVPELYKIKNLLKYDNLSFIMPLLEVEELKLRNTKGKNDTNKVDRFPVDIIDEVCINSLNDYLIFLPTTLPEEFTSAQLKKEAKISINCAQILLLLLTYLNVVERIGKSGRSYLYKINRQI